MTATRTEPFCDVCGVPVDASFFDDSSIQDAPTTPGEERVLASYQLHRNYCGALHYFAQFTNAYALDPSAVRTPGLQWELRCSGQPREPYLRFDRIINPWGLSGFPIHLRLEEGSLVQLVVRFVGVLPGPVLFSGGAVAVPPTITQVGGRLLGRYWYNSMYGGRA